MTHRSVQHLELHLPAVQAVSAEILRKTVSRAAQKVRSAEATVNAVFSALRRLSVSFVSRRSLAMRACEQRVLVVSPRDLGATMPI